MHNALKIYISAANGIYQNSVFGMAAKLPIKYTGAVVLGSVNITITLNKELLHNVKIFLMYICYF